MIKTLLTAFFCLLLLRGYSQKTEIRVLANTGFLSFAGSYARSTTAFYYYPTSRMGYTFETFGREASFGYGLSGSFTRVTKKNLLFGVDAGYEKLQSHISIEVIGSALSSSYYLVPGMGKQKLQLHFINVFPNIGYRFATEKIRIDLTAGSELGFCLSSYESAKATTSTGETYEFPRHPQKHLTADIRPTIRMTVNYKRYGIYAGYAYGMSNHAAGFFDNEQTAYARILRAGLAYKIF